MASFKNKPVVISVATGLTFMRPMAEIHIGAKPSTKPESTGNLQQLYVSAAATARLIPARGTAFFFVLFPALYRGFFLNLFSVSLFVSSSLVISLLIVNSQAFAADTNASKQDANTSDANISTTHTRTLAASCAACHGSNGNSVAITPVLAGLDAQYFAVQMLAFKQGTRSSTVMQQHAAGLTDLEIDQLAHFFSEQKRLPQQKNAKSLLAPQQAYKYADE